MKTSHLFQLQDLVHLISSKYFSLLVQLINSEYSLHLVQLIINERKQFIYSTTTLSAINY